MIPPLTESTILGTLTTELPPVQQLERSLGPNHSFGHIHAFSTFLLPLNRRDEPKAIEAPIDGEWSENGPRRVEVNEWVSQLIGAEWVTVTVLGRPAMGYRITDRQTRDCVAVQLLKVGLVSLSEAVRGFGIPRSTLQDASRRFEQQGIRGLIPARSGPKEAWKLVTQARRLTLDTIYAHPEWKMPQITAQVNQQLQAEGLATLSERQLRRFLTFCGVLPRSTGAEQKTEQPMPEMGARAPGQDEGDSSTNIVTLGALPVVAEGDQAQRGAPQQPATPLPLTAADRRYLQRLRAGFDTAFGGGLLLVPFLTLIQFPRLITEQLAGVGQGYYTTVQMGLSFFYLALFGIPTLETVKMVVKGELGVLLGRGRAPGLTKLRSFLKTVGKLGRAEALALAAACHQMRAGVVNCEVLFIDGHFIPYYGRHNIRKGYFTTHRMALKGNEAYYANDRQGRPLFFLLTAASITLITILPEIVARVKGIMGEQWCAWGLTLVFDRGGFCAQLFKTLDKLKVSWLTWLKASREVWQQVYQVEEEQFQLYLIRLKSSRVKVKLYEWQVDITGYGSCRAIILLDLKTGNRMVIITNDQSRSLREIAELMLRRWSQENFFKLMLARYYLDYTPGYQFEPAPQDPLIDNPRVKELRRLKQRLQALKRKLESQLSQRLLARRREQVSWHSCKVANDKTVRAIKGLEREIERVKEMLSQIPKQVPLSQAWGQPHQVANLECKGFFDVLKGLAFNGEEWLLERLTPHYQGKDVRQALHQIIFRGTVVQLVDGVLHVRLKPFDSPKVQAAAEALCAELNSQQVCTLDKFKFPIVYEVLPHL